jgi:hypothetical protein
MICIPASKVKQPKNVVAQSVDKNSTASDSAFWSTVNLRQVDVPKGVNDIANDYVNNIEPEMVFENSTEIDGVKLSYHEALPKGPDSGQVPTRELLNF